MSDIHRGRPDDLAQQNKDTVRADALSDGVIAIAITLLILEIRLPEHIQQGGLLDALISLWPSLLAYTISFSIILIMWVNHHNMFRLIARTDTPFLFINGLLLMAITFLNFPTVLLARYLNAPTPDSNVAVAVYALTGLIIAGLYNALWIYVRAHPDLFDSRADREHVASITRSYRFGPIMYLAAVVLALVSVPLSLLVLGGLAVFFAATTRPVALRDITRPPDPGSSTDG